MFQVRVRVGAFLGKGVRAMFRVSGFQVKLRVWVFSQNVFNIAVLVPNSSRTSILRVRASGFYRLVAVWVKDSCRRSRSWD